MDGIIAYSVNNKVPIVQQLFDLVWETEEYKGKDLPLHGVKV